MVFQVCRSSRFLYLSLFWKYSKRKKNSNFSKGDLTLQFYLHRIFINFVNVANKILRFLVVEFRKNIWPSQSCRLFRLIVDTGMSDTHSKIEPVRTLWTVSQNRTGTKKCLQLKKEVFSTILPSQFFHPQGVYNKLPACSHLFMGQAV